MPSKKKTAPKPKRVDGETKFLAFIGIFLPLIGYLIGLLVRHDDEYVMYYGKQGLVLFLFGLVLQLIVVLIEALIPIYFLDEVVWVLLAIVWILGWVNAISGEKRKTVIIGDLVEKVGL